MNKYGNRKTIIDGVTFDSKRESARYADLILLQKAGKIKDLVLQPRFLLQDQFRGKDRKWYRPIYYVADFAFYDVEKGEQIVEDVKGVKTPLYSLKKKLFLFKYPDINFYEIC